MSQVLLIGAGPLAQATLPHLLRRGDEVTVVTRSGTALAGARALTADITDPSFPQRAPAADAYVVACNFPYGRWDRHWPAATTHLLAAAGRSGSRVVLAGNLYAYGPPRRPMRESDPLRATYTNGRMRTLVWERLLAAHHDGAIRAVEVRGSDYIGPRTGPNAHGGDRVLRPALAGKAVRPLGDPDQPHTWTATEDMGRLLARAAHDPAMEGRAWHVPSAPACSLRELVSTALDLAGRDGTPRITPIRPWQVRAMGTVSPQMSALSDVLYQFTAPFVMDDSAARTLLGEEHTPLETTLVRAVEALAEDEASDAPGRAR